MIPFGVNSDPSFRAQKRRIRVRVSSFRTAGTVLLLSLVQRLLHFLEFMLLGPYEPCELLPLARRAGQKSIAWLSKAAWHPPPINWLAMDGAGGFEVQ